MSDATQDAPPVPAPDVRGRRLDHPGSEPLKAELLALTRDRTLSILVPINDLEAANFAGMIVDFLQKAGRTVELQPVRFDPPFRGIQIHDGADRAQLAIGHR